MTRAQLAEIKARVEKARDSRIAGCDCFECILLDGSFALLAYVEELEKRLDGQSIMLCVAPCCKTPSMK